KRTHSLGTHARLPWIGAHSLSSGHPRQAPPPCRNRLTGSGRSSNIGTAGSKVPARAIAVSGDMADLFRAVLVARNLHLPDLLHIFGRIIKNRSACQYWNQAIFAPPMATTRIVLWLRIRAGN